jgi:chromosome segregation ATPase
VQQDPQLACAPCLDLLVDKAVQVCFEGKNALEELGNKYKNLLVHCSEVSSQLKNYEAQLVQSEEQLYEARSKVDSLNAQVSEGQSSMQTIRLINLNSFLNATILKLERKLELQKESFVFSAEQRSMQLEDSSSRIAELSVKLDDQFKLSNQQFYDRMNVIRDLEVQLFDSDQLIVKKDCEIEKLRRQVAKKDSELGSLRDTVKELELKVKNNKNEIDQSSPYTGSMGSLMASYMRPRK